ncbi:MAG: cytochrome c maturation protein CcmE [Rickettsiaceae bacterium H1]|nr:cytochrome c maturation protein CcmE [Rickettsiaceae bacterium H1]
MKKKYKRLFSLTLLLTFCIVGIVIIAGSLRDNISFFYYPTELLSANIRNDKKIRLGGIVVLGSIVRTNSRISFDVTDNKNVIPVIYTKKVLPNLFKENNGVVADGHFVKGKFFATGLLAKHSENYRRAD